MAPTEVKLDRIRSSVVSMLVSMLFCCSFTSSSRRFSLLMGWYRGIHFTLYASATRKATVEEERNRKETRKDGRWNSIPRCWCSFFYFIFDRTVHCCRFKLVIPLFFCFGRWCCLLLFFFFVKPNDESHGTCFEFFSFHFPRMILGWTKKKIEFPSILPSFVEFLMSSRKRCGCMGTESPSQ